MESVNRYRTEYFDNYLSDPYSLGYFGNTYLKEEHTEEEIVERGILSVYNYLKYIIRHYDNGYGNFGTRIDLECKISEKYLESDNNLTRKYKKYMKYLLGEDLFGFEFLMFSLGLLIREKDPKDKTGELSDYTFPNTHTYPNYRLLVNAHEKKINITFHEAMNIILSESYYYYNEETYMSEKEYFAKTFELLVCSLKDI